MLGCETRIVSYGPSRPHFPIFVWAFPQCLVVKQELCLRAKPTLFAVTIGAVIQHIFEIHFCFFFINWQIWEINKYKFYTQNISVRKSVLAQVRKSRSFESVHLSFNTRLFIINRNGFKPSQFRINSGLWFNIVSIRNVHSSHSNLQLW